MSLVSSTRKLPYNQEKITTDLVNYVKDLIKELEDQYEELAGNILAGSGSLLKDSTVPATAADPGEKGQIEWDDTYIYLCVDTDTWITFKKDASFKP